MASDELEMTTVFETGNPGTTAIVKSILDAAEIPYFAKGETLQDLFGWGSIGAGFDIVCGPVQFQVSGRDADMARELLAALDGESSAALDDGSPFESGDDEQDPSGK